MTYHVHVFAPNELLTGQRKLVVSESSLPIADILSSPEFDWYPGLCVIVTNHKNHKTAYTGIFGDKECISVAKFKMAGGKDLFKFWETTHQGLKMAKIVQEASSLGVLRKIAYHFVDAVKSDLSESDLNVFETFPKKTPSDKWIRSLVYRASQGSAQNVLLMASYLVLNDDRDDEFSSMCDSYVQYVANVDDTSINTEESLLADMLRANVPFHEIAMWVVR